jgi:hypothetical protein
MPDRFEMNDTARTATRLGRVVQVAYAGLTLTAGDVDFYAFQAGAAGVYQVLAPGTVVQVLDSRGRVMAQGYGSAAVSASRNASFTVFVQSPGATSVSDYGLTIAAAPSAPKRVPSRRVPFGRLNLPRQTAPTAPSAVAWRAVSRHPSA